MKDFAKGMVVGAVISAWAVAMVLGAVGMTTLAGTLMLTSAAALGVSATLDWLTS